MEEKRDKNRGIYATYSKRIKDISAKNILVIDVKKLAEYVDFDEEEIPYEELKNRFRRAAATVALY